MTIKQYLESKFNKPIEEIEFRDYLDVSSCGITSLDGLPDGFNSRLDCSDNKLTSLHGLPDGFNSKLDCSDNKLESLDGIKRLDPDNLKCDLTPEWIRSEYIRLELHELLI